MHRRTSIATAVISVALSLQACLPVADRSSAEPEVEALVLPAQAQQDPRGIETTSLMLLGKAADVALASDSELRNTLKAFGGNTNPSNLGALVREIRNANQASGGSVPGMTGLGGGYGHAFLDLAEQALDGNGGFDRGKRVTVSLSGQIQDYAFDSAAGSGRLEVITYIASTVVPAGGGTPTTKTEAYKWKVRVDAGGFSVVQRNDSAPDGPFPGTLEFSPAMKQRIQSLGFTRKLWAKGSKIVVEKVWRDANYRPANPNFQELRSSNPRYARLYQSGPESCIDMMFVGEPPADMSGLQAPPFYCLGRCDHPLIINTR